MKKRPLERLGSREREIINTVFALGNRASAEDIRLQLKDAPSSSTVRVMLTRLERKGYLRHTQDGPRYLYSAAESPDTASRSVLKEYLQTFFGGSLQQMVTALVRPESLSDEELDDLKAIIDKARKERRR